jgi:hypothetical protein
MSNPVLEALFHGLEIVKDPFLPLFFRMSEPSLVMEPLMDSVLRLHTDLFIRYPQHSGGLVQLFPFHPFLH